MAYAVNFGIINKKVNSTLQTFTVNNAASCVLKEPSDVLNPTFTYQGAFNEKNNYFYVSDFGRYYWITAITFVLGHWEITGKVDALASFKAEIGSQAQYIVRASADKDGRVPDRYAVAKASPIVTALTGALPLDSFGSYVICAAGASGNHFYMMRGGTWETLYSKVFSSGFLQSYYNVWDAIVQDVTNAVLNPADYIFSAKWLPCAPTGASQSITLGFYDTGVPGLAINPGTVVMTQAFSWTIPDHPQAGAFGNYLNGSPYRRISLFLPGYGNMVIDPDIAATAPDLYIVAEMDITGALTYSIALQSGGNAVWRTAVTCDLSTDAGFSTMKSGITSAIGAVGNGLASGGVLGGLVTGAASAVQNAIPQVERASVGGSRSILATNGIVCLTIENYEIAIPGHDRYGYPLCRYGLPSSYPGYLQCADASVSCQGTQSEIEEINAFLNGGFYYE